MPLVLDIRINLGLWLSCIYHVFPKILVLKLFSVSFDVISGTRVS